MSLNRAILIDALQRERNARARKLTVVFEGIERDAKQASDPVAFATAVRIRLRDMLQDVDVIDVQIAEVNNLPG